MGILCNTRSKNARRNGKGGELSQMARLFVQFGFLYHLELSTSNVFEELWQDHTAVLVILTLRFSITFSVIISVIYNFTSYDCCLNSNVIIKNHDVSIFPVR